MLGRLHGGDAEKTRRIIELHVLGYDTEILKFSAFPPRLRVSAVNFVFMIADQGVRPPRKEL